MHTVTRVHGTVLTVLAKRPIDRTSSSDLSMLGDLTLCCSSEALVLKSSVSRALPTSLALVIADEYCPLGRDQAFFQVRNLHWVSDQAGAILAFVNRDNKDLFHSSGAEERYRESDTGSGKGELERSVTTRRGSRNV